MTENIELNNRRNRFLAPILKSIQLEMDEFMIRVANGECHEMMIHRWAIRLFEKGMTANYAIKVIHRARRFVLINRTNKPYRKESDISLEKILMMLNQHPKYSQLDNDAKRIVQKKIAEMFNNNARIQVIEQVLEKINPNVSVDKEKNRVTFLKTTADRILTAIRKWNLTEYWKNRKIND